MVNVNERMMTARNVDVGIGRFRTISNEQEYKSYPSGGILGELRYLLEKHRIGVPIGSRFASYIKILEDDDAKFPEYQSANIEVMQMIVALKYIGNIDSWRPVIADALTYDALLPAASKYQSRGRDSLFEAHLAGRFSSINSVAIRDEPDLIVARDGFVFSVAAKRIKSEKKILLRVREARDQIERSKIGGIIALDLSSLCDEYLGNRKIRDRRDLVTTAIRIRDDMMERVIFKVKNECRPKNVLAVICFALIGDRMTDVENKFTFAPIHNGCRLCNSDSIESKHVWTIIDRLGSVFA